jgi:hypothetical protein
MTARSAEVFEGAAVPPPVGSTEFSLDLWDSVRNAGISPQFHSGYSEDPSLRVEFLTGARLMGFELEEWDPERRLRELTDKAFAGAERARRRAAGYFDQLLPQQLQIADTLNLEHDTYAFEISRRATKTTSIFIALIGRCATRPGHQVTFSAQSGVMGSRRLREWAGRLDAQNPDPEANIPPWMRGKPSKKSSTAVALFGEDVLPVPERAGRGFRIMRGEVGKGIYFDNGSQFLVLKPEADAYRSEAADESWLDEFQEVDPLDGDDLLAAILPLQDTKLGSSTIVSGTAGEARVGPFWVMIDQLRSGRSGVGGLDYSAPEDTPWEDIEDEAKAMTLLRTVHPGIGTLTTIEKMLKNYRSPTFGLPQWAREYLSIWPESYGTVAIDQAQWIAAQLDKKPAIPTRVAFGMAIRPTGGSAAVCAAWRSPSGLAYVEVLEHRPGTDWIPKFAQYLTTKYRGSTIAYDDYGEGAASATEMRALAPQPRLRVQTFRETAAGCVQFLRDLERATLRHSGQKGLDAAVDFAGKREVRGESGVWLWTPAEKGADITCLDAATRALRNWDQHFAGKATSMSITVAK